MYTYSIFLTVRTYAEIKIQDYIWLVNSRAKALISFVKTSISLWSPIVCYWIIQRRSDCHCFLWAYIASFLLSSSLLTPLCGSTFFLLLFSLHISKPLTRHYPFPVSLSLFLALYLLLSPCVLPVAHDPAVQPQADCGAHTAGEAALGGALAQRTGALLFLLSLSLCSCRLSPFCVCLFPTFSISLTLFHFLFFLSSSASSLHSHLSSFPIFLTLLSCGN